MKQPLMLCLAFGVITGIVVGKLAVGQSYASSAVLLWEPGHEVEDPSRELTTVRDSVKLPVVIESTRAALGLPTTLESLGGRIDVDASTESRLLTVSATAETSDGAQALVSAVAAAFVSHRREVRASIERDRLLPIAEELVGARRELTEARRVWVALQDTHNIADLELERRLTLERIYGLRERSDLARAQAEGERARGEQLGERTAAEPAEIVLSEVESDPYVLRLVDAQRERDSLSAALGSLSPEVLSLSAEIEALRTGGQTVRGQRTVGINPMRSALATQLWTSDSERRAASQRAAELDIRTAGALQRVAELGRAEGPFHAAGAAVELAEARVRELEARRLELQGASEHAVADVRVVAPATAPHHPERPVRRMAAAICVVLWLVVGVGFGVWRIVDRARLHAPSELAFWTGRPVVGSTSWPRDRDDLLPFCRELAGLSSRLKGELLVVPGCASVREQLPSLIETWNAERTLSADGTLVREWHGELFGAALRRAARNATAVVLVVRARQFDALQAGTMGERLGRKEGTATIMIDVGSEVACSLDRVGNVDAFWSTDTPAQKETPCP